MSTTLSLDRKYEYRRKLPHYQKPGRALFITFRKNTREPFSERSRDAILQHCLYDHGKRYELHAAVIMPEHVHLLVSEPETKPLATALQALKLSVSKRSTPKPFWETRYYDFNVFTHNKRVEKLKYMHRNPVIRGLVTAPEDWHWSSYRHYALNEPITIQITKP